VKTAFYDFLGKKSSRMKSVWLKKKLSGEWDPPESVETQKDVVRKIAATPGSVGYVSHSLIADSVKVLLIIQPQSK